MDFWEAKIIAMNMPPEVAREMMRSTSENPYYFIAILLVFLLVLMLMVRDIQRDSKSPTDSR